MKPMLSKRQISGFSMVELLVAVLVMGIGVLGITGLQVLSLQNNRAALLRGEAVHLSYDILDRIRANPTNAYHGLDFENPPPASSDCRAVSCSQEELADFDQRTWKCVLGEFREHANCEGFLLETQPGLPRGDGAIAINGRQVVITVRWQEPNVAGWQEFSVQTQI